MNRFYSSLIINFKQFPFEHQVFRPRYNKQFFKRLEARAEQLEAHVTKRCKNKINSIPDNFRNHARKLVKLKEKHDKAVSTASEEPDLEITKNQIQELEDLLMPFVVTIPNRLSKNVPNEDIIEDEIKSDFLEVEHLSKVLSFTKLSYINNCYSKSIVGPNSYYYYGIGSKLQHGLSGYFSDELEKRGFLPTSGLCLAKSALVEANNSIDVKDYMKDPCRILEKSAGFTTKHVVEASRESLLGFVTTLGPRSSNEPLRLLASGMGYRQGSDWFDSDDKRISQFGTVHILTLNSSIESFSMPEYIATKDIIWALYKNLGIPARLVHCSSDSMISNEYDAYKIELWLPSKKRWIQCSRISHYLDYITVRTGMKRGHIIDSSVYDAQILIAAIIENRQTSNGRFIIPNVIGDHMLALSDAESTQFFRQTPMSNPLIPSDPSYAVRKTLNNHQQRRHFSKKNYVYGHSQKAYKHAYGFSGKWLAFSLLGSFSLIVDWTEIWIQLVPKSLKRQLYDKIYRPVRRVWWYLTYVEGTKKPEDLPFDKLDLKHYDKSMPERRKEKYLKYKSPPPKDQ